MRSGERIHAALLFDTLHRLLPDGSVIVDEIIAYLKAMKDNKREPKPKAKAKE